MVRPVAGYRIFSRTQPSTLTIYASLIRCIPRELLTDRRRCSCIADRPILFDPRSDHGSLTALAPRTKICQPSYRLRHRLVMVARAITVRRSCQLNIKALRSETQVTKL